MPQPAFSVSQLNDYIQKLIGSDGLLASVAVKGEISNYKVYPSGHHYFTLKDENAALKCVMFKNSAIRLRFHPENGMNILAMGRIAVYPRDGTYQLYCTTMLVDGIGDLHAAFEQLKLKLASQGIFDADHKKQLPRFPKRIGIITSSAGAAIHDMLRILRNRYPLTKVLLFPVRVQGTEAPGEIVSAIQYANHHNLADVLIVGRGGGSIEDLWAFNDEFVAHAIYQSEIPIISAVGHEPDVTISDYVADLRAATPSNAAELVVPDQDTLRQSLDAMLTQITSSAERNLRTAKRHLNILSASPVLQCPMQQVSLRRERMLNTGASIVWAQRQYLSRIKQSFISLTAKLDAMSPLKVLTRGYAIVQSPCVGVVRSIQQVETGDTIHITVSDGNMTATVTQKGRARYE